MKTQKKTLVLLDAHAIIHRAYHALPDFTSASGEPTGALYGIVLMILSIADQFKPDYMVAAYDLPGKTFRHKEYPEYKAGRKEIDTALVHQLESSRTLMGYLGIPIYDAPGFEADDMLGTIITQVTDPEIEIVIASGDMDTLQLVDGERVKVFTLRKGLKDTVVYNEKAVNDRFGFGPELLPDYKGLRGDPSDNIVGIKGIGEKAATSLITQFGSIEQIYENLEQDPEGFRECMRPRIATLLEESKDDAFFSKVLATIRRDAPISFSIQEKPWLQSVDTPALIAYLCELGFRTQIQRVEQLFGVSQEKGTENKESEISSRDMKEVSIMLWLLHSDITSPTEEDIYHYSGEKSFPEARLAIQKQLKENGLWDVYANIEQPLIPILEKMKERGMLINTKHLGNLSKEVATRIDELEKTIFKHAGREFNIRSPKQLGEVLFDELCLSQKGLKKTSGGSRSTRESELVKLREEHPIIEDILVHRELSKVRSTYIDVLPTMVDEHDRLHTELLQTGTSTGRFASANPNLQNIPNRGEYGPKIRHAFIAEKGHSLVGIDYSQIELRVAAMLSRDAYMTQVFQEGRDIHSAVAAKVFGVTEEEVDSNQRRIAKVINFGILYGMGVNALRDQLGKDVTQKQAREFYDTYVSQFPSVYAYLETTKAYAHKNGYTKTLSGRRRYFPELRSPALYLRASAERMAMNAPIQGTATADIIKLAMIHVDRLIHKNGWQDGVHMVLQIHDELLFEIRDDMMEVIPEIEKSMQTVLQQSYLRYETRIPLEVHTGTGKHWDEVK